MIQVISVRAQQQVSFPQGNKTKEPMLCKLQFEQGKGKHWPLYITVVLLCQYITATWLLFPHICWNSHPLFHNSLFSVDEVVQKCEAQTNTGVFVLVSPQS